MFDADDDETALAELDRIGAGDDGDETAAHAPH
jgi:hypothetical protein